MDLSQYGHADVSLMEGERVVMAISSNAGGGSSRRARETLALTTSRLMRLSDKGRMAMASLDDVDSVEIDAVKEGVRGAFLWATLAVALSFILYRTLDHPTASLVIPALTLAMGAYLVVNRMLDSGQPTAMFKTGGASIDWRFDADSGSAELHALINRLYAMKAARNGANGGGQPFAPR